MDVPTLQPLKIAQVAGAPTAKQIDALDHWILFAPPRTRSDVTRRLPRSRQLSAALQRASKAKTRTTSFRLENGTGVTVAVWKPEEAFASLTRARRVLASVRESHKLGLSVVGFADGDRDAIVRALVAATFASAFAMPSFKSKANKDDHPNSLRIFHSKPRVDLSSLEAEALGNNLARWLTALPPNKLTVSAYREICRSLAKTHGLSFEFLSESKLRNLGAGAFLAVAQGNDHRDAGLIHLRYRPGRETKPALALVGKGILFDTGGVNLKPFKGMLEMHTDMQGSAVALGTGIALAVLGVPFAFDVWLAVTENVISAKAYKSQDIIEACNGTTIQIIHTDAEGRMVLADTLALAARAEPELIMDYATLTGACVAALTTRYSGVFSNRMQALPELVAAGQACGERVWGFPLDDDFDEAIESDIADVKQCAADGSGDHILAARFLRRFVPDRIAWVHMDLSSGQHKGGLAHIPSEITGFGVRFTLHLLLDRFDTPSGFVASLT